MTAKGNNGTFTDKDGNEFEITSWKIEGKSDEKEIKILEKFYYECVYFEGAPKFDELDESSRLGMLNTLGYQLYKLELARKSLWDSIKKALRFDTFMGFINN